MKVKTEELIGTGLDWAVNLCLSEDDIYELYGAGMVGEVSPGVNFKPSADWSYGGPLVDMFKVGIEQSEPSAYAYVPGKDLDGSFAETPLIAICRAVVACKLGKEVEIPDELMELA